MAPCLPPGRTYLWVRLCFQDHNLITGFRKSPLISAQRSASSRGLL